MWVIFLASACIFAAVALLLCRIGHRIYLAMKREEEIFQVEKEAYQTLKENVKEKKP